jgi:pimeloyl-ACP methyl ester carboxylesterase
MSIGHASLCLGALLFCSCSTVNVRTIPDEVTDAALQSTDLLEEAASAPFDALAGFAEETGDLLKRAERSEFRGKTSEAAGAYLKVAADAYERLASGNTPSGSEEEEALVEIHNSALASFAARWIEDPRRLESGPCRYACGTESIEWELAADSPYTADYFDHLVASESLKKRGIANHTRNGCGAPFVAIREQRPDRGEELRFFPGRGLNVPVTLTIDSVTTSADGGIRKVTFSLRNPLIEDSFALGDRALPLAADFSAPLAVIMRGGNEIISGIDGFFNADERLVHSGLLLLEPYDPDRIPVIFIHGLFSVPMIWRDLIPGMASDPEISKRYQFMLFTYPSSFPMIESAELLRDQIAALRALYDPSGRDPLSRNLVVVGHSMGGVLARSLVTEFGDHLWKQYSDVPLEAVDASPAEKETIRRLIYFPPDPGVTRVVSTRPREVSPSCSHGPRSCPGMSCNSPPTFSIRASNPVSKSRRENGSRACSRSSQVRSCSPRWRCPATRRESDTTASSAIADEAIRLRARTVSSSTGVPGRMVRTPNGSSRAVIGAIDIRKGSRNSDAFSTSMPGCA